MTNKSFYRGINFNTHLVTLMQGMFICVVEYAKHAACLSKRELGEKTLSCTKKYADDMAALVQEVGNNRSSFNSKACV